MNKNIVLSLAAVLLASSFVSTASFAQDVAGHPRVNEVDQRLDNQQSRTDAGVANGTINANQEARDNARDAKVSNELSADEAKNGGHVTKAEQAKMNRQLNKNSKHIHKQKTSGTTTSGTAQ